MIGIASDDRKPQQGFQGRGIAAPQAVQPPAQQPSTMEVAGDMIKQRAMEKGLAAGEKGITGMFSSAPAASVPAAPTMSSVATPLMKSGVDAGLANAVASQSAGAAGSAAAGGAGAAAGAGGMAALGAAVPYIGAGLVAGKALGLFSEGSNGPVGFNPYLSEAMRREENDFNKSRPLQTESAGNTGSVRTAGPLSKIKYKSAGGEVYEFSYGGGPLKG